MRGALFYTLHQALSFAGTTSSRSICPNLSGAPRIVPEMFNRRNRFTGVSCQVSWRK